MFREIYGDRRIREDIVSAQFPTIFNRNPLNIKGS
jgi:hypothetical protein